MRGRKPESPYDRLRRSVLRYFVYEIFSIPVRRKELWTWDKSTVAQRGDLSALRERVIAAGQLGYDVVLVSSELGGLEVSYQKKVPAHLNDLEDRELAGWLTNY